MGLRMPFHRASWQEKLKRTLVRRRGVRLGEATVISRQVHISDPQTPQLITILSSSDAGVTFYSLSKMGEIIHLDVFHEVAEVDHRRIAAALLTGLASTGSDRAEADGRAVLDYFDLITATGGGRVTGDLNYGRKESLRAAHRNHVHLAGRLGDEQLHLLFPMVAAVEEEIGAQGFEIRRIEKLHHANWSKGNQMDLSHYTDPESDSWLKGNPGSSSRSEVRSHGEQTGGAAEDRGSAGASAAAGQSLRSSRHETRSGQGGETQANGGENGAGAYGGSGSGSVAAGSGLPGAQSVGNTGSGAAGSGSHGFGQGKTASGWDTLAAEQRLQAALELSRRLGSPDEVKRVLDELSREQGWASLYGSGSSQAPFVIRQLEDEGLIRRDVRGLRLTETGSELAAYLGRHLRDVKLRFRKLIRRMPASALRKNHRSGKSKSPPSAEVRYGPVRDTGPADPGAWLGDLAVPETISAALKRTRLERLHTESTEGPSLSLHRRDLHVHLRSGEQTLNICLLIDASASMAGRRILAAKHLARHLLVSTRDRIAVIAFQERDVRVYVPFTRDYSQVEEGLSRIQPMGLTPLAQGLTRSLDLIRQSRVRRPLLLLITDGIPTVPMWSIDPLADALEAARHVGAARIPFGCIGLQPSRRYLEDLARVGGGTLHVVEELNEDALVTIAHHERYRTAQKGW